ncbi:Receptor protein serine/threonine kinase [Aphelenchoides besseyi]|nr:Receptor protein serine/threonine kinase [Aphelenchoides besseyi]
MTSDFLSFLSLLWLPIAAIEIPADAIGRPESSFAYNRHSADLANSTSRNLCYCSYGAEICDYEDTCVKHEQAACFHAIQEGYNELEQRMETWHYFGCAPLERGSNGSHLTCNIWRSAHATPKSIACCYEGNYCNMNITPPAYVNVVEEDEYVESNELHNRRTFLLVSIFAGCLVGGVFTLLAWLLVRRFIVKGKLPKMIDKLHQNNPAAVQTSLLGPVESEKSCGSEMTWESGSGSDSGLVTLNQRTIALNLTLMEMVARGRYGEVRRALYRGTVVAVKMFYTTEEESWKNERDIYQTEMLNHENILQFVAADISSTADALTQMLLVTDYHPLGSLYDYLRQRGPLELGEGLNYAQSIVAGLEHMHYALLGNEGRRKPEIAHRDLKSKNVIVKRPGVCCIADFGLAVRREDNKILPQKLNVQVGTKRYMPPEVLSASLNPTNFEEFKMADIYAYALVLWEICCRIDNSPQTPVLNAHRRMISLSGSSGIVTCSEVDGFEDPRIGMNRQPKRSTANRSSSTGYASRYRPIVELHRTQEMSSTSVEDRPHRLPYQTWVENDPSFDEMRQLVCIQQKRPPIEDEWTNGTNEVMKELSEIMTECWSPQPKSRHTAYKIKKELNRLINLMVHQPTISEEYQFDRLNL